MLTHLRERKGKLAKGLKTRIGPRGASMPPSFEVFEHATLHSHISFDQALNENT